ncbi:MAG: type II toxin-antitoxin system VapC family toxin [Kiritimatiellae bacterium]|nr:type II toxin-antitoxin system VapC family toxin [Kiritimatiellia bacterium]
MTYLIDTCVISEFTKKSPSQKVIRFLNNMNDIDVAISVITIGEIKSGVVCVSDERKRDRLERWFNEELLLRFKGRTISIDAETMLTWGGMVSKLKTRGITLPVMGSLLAAQCKQHKLCIITRNVKDFEKTEISVVNPWL